MLIRVEIMFSGLICKDNTHAWLYVSSPRYKYITFSNGRDITCRSFPLTHPIIVEKWKNMP